MANKITPKNFLTTKIPEGPNKRSKKLSERSTMKITTKLTPIPNKIL